MKYVAHVGDRIIKSFPLAGKETTEIYGGNTLLWKKSDAPPMREICSITTKWTQVTDEGLQYPCECELSVRNQNEDGSEYFTDYPKAGIYYKVEISKNTLGNYTYNESACIMFRGTMIPEHSSGYSHAIKNVKRILKMWDPDGNLLRKDEEWYTYSQHYSSDPENIFGVSGKNSDGHFTCTLRPVNYGYGPATGNFAPSIMTSGSGHFDSIEELEEYMLG